MNCEVSILVFLNAILIGAQTDYAAQHGGASHLASLSRSEGDKASAKTLGCPWSQESAKALCHGVAQSITFFAAWKT